MPASWVVEPIVALMTVVDGVEGLHDRADAFDYACSKARAEAIDRILIEAVEERGWSLFDAGIVDRVTVEHSKKDARILIDGAPVTPWWRDRLTNRGSEVVWSYVRDDE
jgi:hypothetical protein